MSVIPFPKLFTFEVKFVGQPLEKEHPEDEFLELGGVHFPAKDIGGFEKEAFELGEGDFISGHGRSRILARSSYLVASKVKTERI
jgi:hypothetical protein